MTTTMTPEMSEAREALNAYRATLADDVAVSNDERRRLFSVFVEKCEAAGAPKVRIFAPSSQAAGWFDVSDAYLLTDRQDFRRFCFFASFQLGMCVLDIDEEDKEKYETFDVWDPEAQMFAYCFYGSTNMRPWDHVRSDPPR